MALFNYILLFCIYIYIYIILYIIYYILFSLTNCLIYFLNVILTCYDLIYVFSIRPAVTHFMIISVYLYSISTILEIFCKVYQALKMRAVNKYFSFTLYKC